MMIVSLSKFWPLMYSVLQEFWSITESHIEDSAVRNNIPIELYLYSELGLGNFSLQDFERRDPFTNPEQFEKVFVRLNVKGWIEPRSDGSYRVTERAREGVRHVVRMGDTQLLDFKSVPEPELERLATLLGRIVAASQAAPSPPERWAIIIRFRVADEYSPLLVQIREHLMDLLAYRDDAHLAAARPHFNKAGIIWLVLGSLWQGSAVNAGQMAEKLAFRRYAEEDFEIAIQAAVVLGWVEPAEPASTYHLTGSGRELRSQAEQLTDEYFYRPWSVLNEDELEELHRLLTLLHDTLIIYRKSR
jgi:hypothetical protein